MDVTWKRTMGFATWALHVCHTTLYITSGVVRIRCEAGVAPHHRSSIQVILYELETLLLRNIAGRCLARLLFNTL